MVGLALNREYMCKGEGGRKIRLNATARAQDKAKDPWLCVDACQAATSSW